MKTFLVKGLVCKDEPVRKHFNLLKNLFKYENFPHKWIGSQSMNRYARISFF